MLGAGPAGLIAAELMRRAGLAVVMAGGERFGLLNPVATQFGSVNILPIFPARESSLARRLGLHETYQRAPAVRVDYLHEVPSPKLQPGPDGSFRDQMRHHANGRSLALAEKQVGSALLDRPLRLLRDKITRHYGPTTFRDRIGHVDGLSPYYRWLEARPSPLPTYPPPLAIDLRAHRIRLSAGWLAYGTLLVTTSLPSFLALAGLSRPLRLLHQGARFQVFELGAPTPANRVLYDCDPTSPVYRVFQPLPYLVTVQLARNAWRADPHLVAARLRNRFTGTGAHRFLQHITVPMCYPLDIANPEALAGLAAELRSLQVYLFGRLAEWMYLDLHELDWDLVDAIGQHNPTARTSRNTQR